MENVIDNKNKKLVIIIAAIVVVALAIIASIIAISFSSSKKNDQEEELTSSLKELGVAFYEDFYYKNIGSSDEERATKLARYESIGIKIDLENLARYNSSVDIADIEVELQDDGTEKVYFQDNECDGKSTRVIIYPKSPYGQKDYEIEIELECGFDE